MYSFEGFSKYIEKLGVELEKNLAAAGISRDPEVVHRCRVAIRRLRGILGLFQCDPALLDEVKELASNLGPLRDIEVQLEFLKRVDLPVRERKSIMTSKLLEWEIERLRVSGLRLNFSSGVFIKKVSKSIGKGRISQYKIYKNLVKRSERVVESLSQDPFENYHIVRISLKKVRYLLEAVEVVEKRFRQPIDHLKEFQDCLGVIHDMEVWLQEPSPGDELPHLKEILQEEKREKVCKFNGFKEEIYKVLEEALNISASLATGEGESYSQELLSLVSSPEEKRKVSEDLASRLSPDPGHSRRVADKCKTIFSVLKEGTALRDEDLDPLSCAALLHDIGHYIGGDEHHKDSYTLIKNSSCLPLNISEREKIAIIARNHRKKPEFNTGLLSGGEVERLKLLSGILRCADGMEVESSEYVDNFTLTYSDNALTFKGTPITPALQERFKRKSSYLSKLLGAEIEYIEKD